MGKLKRKMCEGCGLKQANYGLASEAKRRWCAGCMKAKKAVSPQKQKMCEHCGINQPKYGQCCWAVQCCRAVLRKRQAAQVNGLGRIIVFVPPRIHFIP